MGDEIILLYPKLDPTTYYEISSKCVLQVLDEEINNPTGYVTLLVDGNCDVEVICRQTMNAGEIRKTLDKSLCGCGESNDPNIVFARKDELREIIIDFAKFMLDQGIDDFDCTRVAAGGSVTVTCCQAWNRLISAVEGGGNVFDAANGVLATCFGIV